MPTAQRTRMIDGLHHMGLPRKANSPQDRPQWRRRGEWGANSQDRYRLSPSFKNFWGILGPTTNAAVGNKPTWNHPPPNLPRTSPLNRNRACNTTATQVHTPRLSLPRHALRLLARRRIMVLQQPPPPCMVLRHRLQHSGSTVSSNSNMTSNSSSSSNSSSNSSSGELVSRLCNSTTPTCQPLQASSL